MPVPRIAVSSCHIACLDFAFSRTASSREDAQATMNAQQILSGLGWSALATVVSAMCQLVFTATLSRLLDPAAFGLMAMAAIALRFASFFSQLGFAQALIQRTHLTDEDTTAALLMAAAIGTALYLAMVLGAPLFADGFRSPELGRLIDVLALSLILSTLGSLPLSLLRRQARFKRVNAIEVSSYVIGYGAVGIACAAAKFGVWSLVAAMLSQQAMVLVLGFLAVRYPLAWPVPRSAYAHLWQYGTRYSLVGFLEFLGGNVEALFVGRVFGKTELGLFNRATMLTNLPVELGVGSVNKVLFPALSGMQHDQRRLADGFQMLLLSIGLFSSAMSCGIAAAAPDVVALLLGAKWLAIAPIVAIVALSVPPLFMYVACGVTLDSLGVLAAKLRVQTLTLALKVALVLWLSRWDLAGIAWAVLIAEVARLALGLQLVRRLLAIEHRQLHWPLLLFAATGLAVWTSVSVAFAVAAVTHLPLPLRVLLETLCGAAALAGMLALIARRSLNYAPLQRFDTVSRWHGRLMATVFPRLI